MRNLALAALLLGNSVALAQVDAGASSEVNTALIWGGGKTAKEAEAARDRWIETAMVAREHVALAEGYPKVVKSDLVKGLNPGLYVTLLGMCREEEAQRFVGAMQGMGPGSYSKKVAVTAKSECPRLLQAKSTWSAKAKQKDGGSVSAAVFHPVKGGGAFALFFILDKRGHESGYAQLDLFEGYAAGCTGLEVSSKGEHILVRAQCAKPVCKSQSVYRVNATLGVGDEGPAVLESTEQPISEAKCP